MILRIKGLRKFRLGINPNTVFFATEGFGVAGRLYVYEIFQATEKNDMTPHEEEIWNLMWKEQCSRRDNSDVH